MSIKRAISAIVVPRLEEVGFVLAYSGSHDWIFARKVGDVTQQIMFVKSQHRPNSLRVDLSTSLTPLPWPLAALMDSSPDWWEYAGDESLQAVLNELVGCVFDKGLGWFDGQAGT